MPALTISFGISIPQRLYMFPTSTTYFFSTHPQSLFSYNTLSPRCCVLFFSRLRSMTLLLYVLYPCAPMLLSSLSVQIMLPLLCCRCCFLCWAELHLSHSCPFKCRSIGMYIAIRLRLVSPRAASLPPYAPAVVLPPTATAAAVSAAWAFLPSTFCRARLSRPTLAAAVLLLYYADAAEIVLFFISISPGTPPPLLPGSPVLSLRAAKRQTFHRFLHFVIIKSALQSQHSRTS